MLVMEGIASEYGWAPDVIDRQDPEILAAFMAINAGRSEAQKRRIDRKTKKQFKGR